MKRRLSLCLLLVAALALASWAASAQLGQIPTWPPLVPAPATTTKGFVFPGFLSGAV